MHLVDRAHSRATLLAASVALAVPLFALSASFASAAEDFRALVFSKTAGFRHGSIPDGIALLQALGAANNFGVDATEDATQFTDQNLANYGVVVWLSTTGDVLDGAQQAAFERFVQSGGGYVGVHSATDTEYGWPWYGQLIGGDAWFRSHPAIQTATLEVEDASHVSTQHYPPTFSFTDEWYNFRENPRPSVNVLVTIDESSYNPGANAMGADHPISWYHDFDGGRSWYTAMGHRSETFADADFGQHLLGGVLWASGTEQPDCDDGNPCTDDVSVQGSCQHVANTAACDDGNDCTTDDTCAAGICRGTLPPQCDDGDPCTQDSCDGVGGGCVNAQVPAAACLAADRARVRLLDRGDVAKRKLNWKWVNREPLLPSVLGDPSGSTGYALCVYDSAAGEDSFSTELILPPNGAWNAKANGAFIYRDKTRARDGLQAMLLRPGGLHDARVKLKAIGSELPMPSPVGPERFFDQDPVVTVQLVNDEGMCWVSQFTASRRNDVQRFVAKLP